MSEEQTDSKYFDQVESSTSKWAAHRVSGTLAVPGEVSALPMLGLGVMVVALIATLYYIYLAFFNGPIGDTARTIFVGEGLAIMMGGIITYGILSAANTAVIALVDIRNTYR